MKRFFWSRFKLLYGIIGSIVLLSVVYYFYPASLLRQLRGVGLMETRSLYILPVANGDTLFFSWHALDSLPKHLNTNPDSARSHAFSSAFFISPSGRLFTALHPEVQSPKVISEHVLLPALHKEYRRIKALRLIIQGQLKELEYYRKTHSVVDEGYAQVMTYNEILKQNLAKQDTLLSYVGHLLNEKPTARLKTEYLLHWSVEIDSGVWHTEKIPCQFLNKDSSGAMQVQTINSLLPTHAYSFALPLINPRWWSSAQANYFMLGYHRYFQHVIDADSVHPFAARIRLQDTSFSLPSMPFAHGAPVVNALGQLVGMNLNGTLYPIAHLRQLQQESGTGLNRFVENVKAICIQTKRNLQEEGK